MAIRARKEPPSFGSPERQRVIEEMHARMIQRMTAATSSPSMPQEVTEGSEPSQTHHDAAGNVAAADVAAAEQEKIIDNDKPAAETATQQVSAVSSSTSVPPQRADGVQPQERVRPAFASATSHRAAQPAAVSSSDNGLTLLAIALVLGIVAIVVRKAMGALRDVDFLPSMERGL